SLRKMDKQDLFHDVAFELSEKDILDIDIRAMGNVIRDRAFALSRQVYEEILRPISQWLGDPDFLKKFEVDTDNHIPNWAAYKRRARQWNKQQKAFAAERLRLYWQEIHRKQRYRKELETLLGNAHCRTCTDTQMHSDLSTAFITDLVTPFSPTGQHMAKVALEFTHALKLSISNLLPWKLLIIADIRAGVGFFSDLTPYYTRDLKTDRIAKLQNVLQMANDGEINLEQETHNGDIKLTSLELKSNTEIIIKDRAGKEIYRDWVHDLSDAQRNMVIADAIERKIICKTV
ncbi:hypothetical protein ACFL1Z_08170, partial [Thermodesulfobacteriota bacterium]